MTIKHGIQFFYRQMNYAWEQEVGNNIIRESREYSIYVCEQEVGISIMCGNREQGVVYMCGSRKQGLVLCVGVGSMGQYYVWEQGVGSICVGVGCREQYICVGVVYMCGSREQYICVGVGSREYSIYAWEQGVKSSSCSFFPLYSCSSLCQN